VTELTLLINAAALRGQGSAWLGAKLSLALCEAWEPDPVQAWVPAAWPPGRAELPNNLSLRPVAAGPAHKFWVDNVSVPHCRAGKRRCILSFGDTGPVNPTGPHVLFVQQAFLAYPPRLWTSSIPWKLRAKFLLMEKYLAAGLRNVSLFLVQGKAMQTNLCERWDLPSDRVRVVRVPARGLPQGPQGPLLHPGESADSNCSASRGLTRTRITVFFPRCLPT